MFYNSSLSNKNRKFSTAKVSGFGLIELMVSISIMALVSGIILTRHTSFNSAVLLRSQTYEVALQLRDLQLNAVSSAYLGDESEFRDSLGAFFSTQAGNNSFFMIFRDSDRDGLPTTGEEFGQRGILDDRFEIRNIRVVDASGTSNEDSVSVLFQRPNFDAYFYDGEGNLLDEALSVEIDVARKGVTGVGINVLRTLEVTSAGQISVKSEE